MSGPCLTANDNIVVQLGNDVNATFSDELTSLVTIPVLKKNRTAVIEVIYWRRKFIKLQWSVHMRYFINYILFNCPLSSLSSSIKSVNLRKIKRREQEFCLFRRMIKHQGFCSTTKVKIWYICIFLMSTRVALAIGSTSSHQRAMSGSNSSGCGRISDRKMEPRWGSNLHKALRSLQDIGFVQVSESFNVFLF